MKKFLLLITIIVTIYSNTCYITMAGAEEHSAYKTNQNGETYGSIYLQEGLCFEPD